MSACTLQPNQSGNQRFPPKDPNRLGPSPRKPEPLERAKLGHLGCHAQKVSKQGLATAVLSSLQAAPSPPFNHRRASLGNPQNCDSLIADESFFETLSHSVCSVGGAQHKTALLKSAIQLPARRQRTQHRNTSGLVCTKLHLLPACWQ